MKNPKDFDEPVKLYRRPFKLTEADYVYLDEMVKRLRSDTSKDGDKK